MQIHDYIEFKLYRKHDAFAEPVCRDDDWMYVARL